MALDGGTAGLASGTGTKTVNMGVSMTGMTWLKACFQNPSYKDFKGFSYSGTSYQYAFSAPGETVTANKFFRIKDTSGTVVLEGTFTGFTSTGFNFNITTNTIGSILNGILFEWGN